MKTPEQLRAEFWENDIASGGWIYNQYKEIHQVLLTHNMQWVQERILDIKRHAITHTEFYRNYLLEDDFPVLDKMQILAQYDAHRADTGFSLPIHVSSTSGSTGTPFSVLQDYQKRMRNIADLQVFGELCNYPPRERMVFFRVLSEKLHRTAEQEARENIYYVDSSDLGPAHLDEMMQVLIEKKPRIVFSYASTLVELAKYIDTKAMLPLNLGIHSVLTAGEGISEENRQLLEKVFSAKVYRRYSDMELGILGQDGGDGGVYTLNYGSYYIECLKLDCDEATEINEVGRIVITDLFNYAFPMIRYDTGDLGIMERYEDGRFPVLKEIYGRKRDCVYSTDGKMISPARISVSLWGVQGIKQWQFIQESKIQYTFKINGDSNVNFSPVIDRLTEILGEDAVIKIEYVTEIPVVASNKRRAVICNYQPEEK